MTQMKVHYHRRHKQPAAPKGWRIRRKLSRYYRKLKVASSVRHIHGPQTIEYRTDEAIALCLLRDGEAYLQPFLDHHFELGLKHVVLLDNGSQDRTLDVARDYSRVTILQSLLPFRRFQWLMRDYLVHKFARNRWSLSLDVDEHFDYPYSDVLPFNSLLRYLANYGYTAVVAYMLDRFGNAELNNTVGGPGVDPSVACPFYDVSNIHKYPYHDFSLLHWGNQLSNDSISWYCGGIRESAFGANVTLTKQPLVYFGAGVDPHPGHHVRNAKIADFTSLLHHYKFFGKFREYVERVVREQTHRRSSEKYGKILHTLEADPEIRLVTDDARRFHSVNELVDVGFLVSSEPLQQWVASLNRI